MILVTGGAGYIGSHVNALLSDHGIKAVVVDDLSIGHGEMVGSGEFVIGDKHALEKVFTSYRIEHVVHLAAFAYVDDSIARPREYYNNNVANTLRLLDTMLEHDVKNFIFSSTSAVYADSATGPLFEGSPKVPNCPYGRSKLFIEQVLQDYRVAYGMKYVAFRYFNAAGADPKGRVGEWHEPESHLIPVVLDAALGKRKDIKIFGTDYPTQDGTCVRDFTHVMDIAGAHMEAIKYLAQGGESEIFNLGSGTGHSVAEIISAARRVTGRKIEAVPSGRRAGDVAISIADCTRAKSLLSWQPQHADLDEIIGSAWRWHQQLYSMGAS
jgi:UDP-glucose 4-epimerase